MTFSHSSSSPIVYFTSSPMLYLRFNQTQSLLPPLKFMRKKQKQTKLEFSAEKLQGKILPPPKKEAESCWSKICSRCRLWWFGFRGSPEWNLHRRNQLRMKMKEIKKMDSKFRKYGGTWTSFRFVPLNLTPPPPLKLSKICKKILVRHILEAVRWELRF